MRDRGKSVVEWDGFESRCRRHPQNQGTGICPVCLRERLNKLFCPDCGEQRQRHSSASSCSCSEASTSSSSAMDCMKNKKKCDSSDNGNGGGGGSVEVGSVGRISFLIESDRPEFEPSKAEAAIVLLRRSKSAAIETTRAAPMATGFEPLTPKIPTKKWYTILSFVLFKKKKKIRGQAKEDCKDCKDSGKEAPRSSVSSNGGGSDRIVVERLLKSRSVGVGRRSFSGYGYFWENNHNKSRNSSVFCSTPSRAMEILPPDFKGSNLGAEEGGTQSQRRSGRGWSWAFASPMRAFRHSKAALQRANTNNPPSPAPAELCRG